MPLHPASLILCCFLSNLSATRHSPIYTTYAAARERSTFTLDEGYHLRFYDVDKPIAYVTDNAGSWSFSFVLDGRTVENIKDMASEPVITTSYNDIVKYHYRPFKDIRVDVTFFVYSSRVALQAMSIRNTGTRVAHVEVKSSLSGHFTHQEPADTWVKEHNQPHVTDVQDEVLLSGPMEFTLAPGAARQLRVARAVAPADSSMANVLADALMLMKANLQAWVRSDEVWYRSIPPLHTSDARKQMLYWNAFTLLRQSMLPPEGAAKHNYYVFSREPQWGWGHGGQVFHESMSMLAYALMDGRSAMASQRVYAERQHADGYIPYRVGPYLEETIPYEGQLTTSAPLYAWENWQIYRITRDRAFLRDMYGSSRRFYDWIAMNRDQDKDGLYEWGGHAVLESLRDGDVAVWDQVGWPSNFEALDMNAMMVSEADALASMARELGLQREAAGWRMKAAALRRLIEKTFWDDDTGFYYHADRAHNSFTFKQPNDLKRREIIGFLPLWAGISSQAHARRLVKTLTDTTMFWRRNGVPSLAANDAYYNSHGYWNGPVWVEWNYFIERGLLRYGRRDLAKALTDRVAEAMIAQLEKNHVFWEMYGPDDDWAGHHQVYIWAGLISRMLLDAETNFN